MLVDRQPPISPSVHAAVARLRKAAEQAKAVCRPVRILTTNWSMFDRYPMVGALRPADPFYSQRQLSVADLTWLQHELQAVGIAMFAKRAGAAIKLVHGVNHCPWGVALDRHNTTHYLVLARAFTSYVRSLELDFACALGGDGALVLKDGIARELEVVSSRYPSITEMVGEYRGRALFVKVLLERRKGTRTGEFPSWVPILQPATELKAEFRERFPDRHGSAQWLHDSLLDPDTRDWLMQRLSELIRLHGVGFIDVLWTCQS